MKLLSVLALLAATMQGEVEVLDSDEAALRVFEVAMNRVRDPRFPDDLESVLREGFYGWMRLDGQEPSGRYMYLAWLCLHHYHTWYHPALYLLSADDLEEMGGINWDKVLFHHRLGPFAVYGMVEWPG